jgi:hypothetical protein
VADPSYRPWRRQWEHNRQLLLTKIAVEQGIQEPVSFAYIIALEKGRRMAESGTGLEKQWSPFLYSYHKKGNPPMEAEDWQLRWKWVDAQGNNHTLGKAYKRETIFTYPFEGKPADMGSTEYWVRSLPHEAVMGLHEVLGPFSFVTHAEKSVVRSAYENEREWQERVWAINDVGEQVDWDESHPKFIEALDVYAPQSWHCHPYGKDCPFLRICNRDPGWEDPIGSGYYELRRPHHDPEAAQAASRGIELPDEQEEDDDGE